MYVPLDVNFPDDDKIIAAGLDGAGLYTHALCLAKRLEQDGKISRAHLHRFGASDELIDRLVALTLFTENNDGLWITAWLRHNESLEEIDGRRASDAQRKRTARRKRPTGQEQASAGNPPDAESASGHVQPLEIETEIETQSAAAAEDASVRDADIPTSRDECITAAVELLLLRDGTIERSALKDNPAGWLRSAKQGRRSDHWQAACKAWHAGMTVEQLADELEPPAQTTFRRLTEYVAGLEPSDLDVAKVGAQAAKSRLRAVREETA
jgi:hypothetical protein